MLDESNKTLPELQYDESIALLALSLSRAGSINLQKVIADYVFQPGGVVTAPNVFTDETSLKTALAKSQGDRSVLLDPTFAPGGVITIAGGQWSAQLDLTLIGLTLPTTFEVAVHFTGPISGVKTFRYINATNATGGSAIVVPAGTFQTLLFDFFFLSNSPTPFIDATATGALLDLIWGGESGLAFTSNDQQLIAVSAGGEASLILNGNASIARNGLVGPAASFFPTMTPGSAINLPQSLVTGGTLAPTLWGVAPNTQTRAYLLSASAAPPQHGIQQTRFGNTAADLQAVCTAVSGPGGVNNNQFPKAFFFTAGTMHITAGTYNFGSGNTWMTGGDPCAITIDDGVAVQGIFNLQDLQITNANSAGGVIIGNGSPDVTSNLRAINTQFSQTGAGSFYNLFPANDTPNLYLSQGTTFATSSGPVLQTTAGAGGSQRMHLWVDATCTIAANTLSAGVGTTIVVHGAAGANISTTQLGAGTIIFEFANANSAQTNQTETTAPNPVNQTTPNGAIIAACVLTPFSSGKFLVTGTIDYSATATNTPKFDLNVRTKVAAIAYGSATATGTNCFVASTATGMTLAAAPQVLVDTFTDTVLAGQLNKRVVFSAIVAPNANNGITIGQNLAFEIVVTNVANDVTGMKTAVGAVEL